MGFTGFERPEDPEGNRGSTGLERLLLLGGAEWWSEWKRENGLAARGSPIPHIDVHPTSNLHHLNRIIRRVNAPIALRTHGIRLARTAGRLFVFIGDPSIQYPLPTLIPNHP